MAKALYEFGPFQLDPAGRRLLRDGEVVNVTPKALDTLLALVENRGRKLSRGELISTIWPDTTVGEHNLNQCIAVLRKTLDDNPRQPNYIATLPGHGYAFVAELRVIGNGVEQGDGTGNKDVRPKPARLPASGWQFRIMAGVALCALLLIGAGYYAVTHAHVRRNMLTQASPAIKIRRSVAVLNFENLSRQEDAAWLSTALAEMLTTELGAGGKLRTVPGEKVSRASNELELATGRPLSDKGAIERIHQNLGADVIVTGSYTVLAPPVGTDRQIRLDMRVQDVRSGEAIASIVQTGTVTELFSLVSRAGAEMRRDLSVPAISTEEDTSLQAALPANSEAARLYSQGLTRIRNFDMLGARDFLVQAVARDPDFPLAHLALASVWQFLGQQDNYTAETRKAWELSEHLSRENQLLIEGQYLQASNQWDKAIEADRSLLTFFPDNIEYGLRLADAQTYGGHAPDALHTVETLRKLPSPVSDDPRIDLAQAAAAGAATDLRQVVSATTHAADRAQKMGARLLYAHAISLQAGALGGLGETDKAIDLARKGGELCSQLGDMACVAADYRRVGIFEVERDPKAAEVAFRKALAIAQKIGARTEEGNNLNGLAAIYAGQGDFAKADPIYRQLLDYSRKNNYKWGTQMFLNNLGNDLILEGKLSEARKMEEEGLAISRQSGQKIGIADELVDLGEILELQGDLAGAQKNYEESVSVFREMGAGDTAFSNQILNGQLTASQLHVARIQALLGDRKKARSVLDDVESKPLLPGVALPIAYVHLAFGEKDAALNWVQKAVEERDAGTLNLRLEPYLKPLQSDPRFIALAKQAHAENR